ncbi:MAG: hypothetical protein V3V59_05910 [Thermodesulfovibrionales bacterium]
MWKKYVFVIFLFLTMGSNASAISVKVNVANESKSEKLSDYPFLIKVIKQEQDGSHATLKSEELRTGPAGDFQGKVDVSVGHAIVGEVNYRGITYSSPLISVERGKEVYSLDIPVYDITDNSEHVAVVGRKMIVSPQDRKTVQVFEILRIENGGNLSYVGKFNDELDVHQILFIPLPAGYRLTHAQGIDSRKILTYNKGIVTQDEIIPGYKEVTIGYRVRSDIGVFDLSLFSEKDAPEIRNFSFLLQKNSEWKVKLSGLKPTEESEFWGKKYSEWKTSRSRSVFRIKVLGPSHRGVFGIWAIAFILSIVVSGAGLYSGKERIFRWNLTREKNRLKGILSQLRDEADNEDLQGYYGPFRRSIETRLEEIEQGLNS